MPSVVQMLLHPERRRPAPEPLSVSMRPVFLTGIVAWLLALVVAVLLWGQDSIGVTPVWTCAAGAAIGAAGSAWTRVRRHH